MITLGKRHRWIAKVARKLGVHREVRTEDCYAPFPLQVTVVMCRMCGRPFIRGTTPLCESGRFTCEARGPGFAAEIIATRIA